MWMRKCIDCWGWEADKESVVALVPLGRASEDILAAPLPIDALAMPIEPLSPKMVEYSAIYEMHRSSSLESPEEVADLRGRTPALRPYEGAGDIVQLPREGDVRVRGLEETILRRGSTEDVCSRPDLGRGAVSGPALHYEGNRR